MVNSDLFKVVRVVHTHVHVNEDGEVIAKDPIRNASVNERVDTDSDLDIPRIIHSGGSYVESSYCAPKSPADVLASYKSIWPLGFNGVIMVLEWVSKFLSIISTFIIEFFEGWEGAFPGVLLMVMSWYS